MRKDLTLFVRLAYGRSNYVQTERSDNEVDPSIGLRYYVTKLTYLAVNYRYTGRVSGDETQDFNRNEAFFTVGSAF